MAGDEILAMEQTDAAAPSVGNGGRLPAEHPTAEWLLRGPWAPASQRPLRAGGGAMRQDPQDYSSSPNPTVSASRPGADSEQAGDTQ